MYLEKGVKIEKCFWTQMGENSFRVVFPFFHAVVWYFA